MPLAAEKRRQLLAMRRHVREVLALPRGCASGPCESVLMSASRKLQGMCSTDERLRMLNGVFPACLSTDLIRNTYDNPAGGPRNQHRVECSATVSDTKHRWSRAFDVFLQENKDKLKRQCLKQRCSRKTSLYQRWRRLGARTFKRFPPETKQEYLGKAQAGRAKTRNQRGFFESVAPDDVGKPTDALQLRGVNAFETPKKSRAGKDMKMLAKFGENVLAQLVSDCETPKKTSTLKTATSLVARTHNTDDKIIMHR